MTAGGADRLKEFVRVPAFTALVAALGLLPAVPVPFIPVPITAQTFGVMLAGLLLSARGAALSLLLFLILTALGFPLLSGGRGGLGVFATPSAGFLVAFPFAAAMTAYFRSHLWVRYTVARGCVCALIGGVVVMYVIGVPWMAAVAQLPFQQALLGTAVFLPGDTAKAILAAIVAGLVRRGYPALQT